MTEVCKAGATRATIAAMIRLLKQDLSVFKLTFHTFVETICYVAVALQEHLSRLGGQNRTLC